VIEASLAGLLAGLGLIVAIGAQNAWVLRQGLARDHVVEVVLICIAADIFLISAGTAGVGALVRSHPDVLEGFKWAGAAYLFWFATRSFRTALESKKGLEASTPTSTRGSVVATTLALTFLNPHVYLDTVLMLGNLAAARGDLRWWFAGGAALGSVIWFTALGFGAHKLAEPLSRPKVWMVIDYLIGAVMVVLAVYLINS
jgi:L-lysine exporter family protein LysE/ArgO